MLYRRHTTVVDWMLAVRGPGFRNESIIKRRQRDYCGFSENYRPRVGKHFRGGFFDRYLECRDRGCGNFPYGRREIYSRRESNTRFI